MKNEFDELPQVIYVATPERTVNYRWAEGSKNISPSVKILTKESVLQLECEKPKHIMEGDILMLHPFKENMYINVNDVQNIKYAKFYAYKRIAQQLGAIHYEVVSASQQTTKRTFGTDNHVTYGKLNDLGLNVKNEKDFLKKMGFSLKADFDGVSSISQESYDKAKQLVKEFNLETDAGITALIESRDPIIKNQETYEEVTCFMMNEINSTLDVAFSLKAANSVFSLDSKTTNSIENTEIVKLTIKYTFPKREAK